MNQLIAKTNAQNIRSSVELKVEQKYMIIDYANQNTKLKQTQLIDHFSRLFQVNTPKTTMSGFLSKKIQEEKEYDVNNEVIKVSSKVASKDLLNYLSQSSEFCEEDFKTLTNLGKRLDKLKQAIKYKRVLLIF